MNELDKKMIEAFKRAASDVDYVLKNYDETLAYETLQQLDEYLTDLKDVYETILELRIERANDWQREADQERR